MEERQIVCVTLGLVVGYIIGHEDGVGDEE